MSDSAKAKPSSPPPGEVPVAAQPAPTRGLWQVPALLVATGLLGGGIITGFLTRPKADLEGMMARAEAAVAAEKYDEALEYLNTTIRPYHAGGALSPELQQQFHLLRGRSVALAGSHLDAANVANATTVDQEFADAVSLGAELDPRDTVLWADAMVTLGRVEKAREMADRLPVTEQRGKSRVVRRIVERSLADAAADPVPTLRLLGEFLATGGLPASDRGWALARQGELLMKQGLADQAIAKLLQTMPGLLAELAPDQLGDLRSVLGRAYYDAGALNEAGKQLDEAARQFLESDPRWASVQALLGRIDEQTGEPGKAKQRYEAVLSRVPEGPGRMPPMLGLAEVRATLGELDESAQVYRELIQKLVAGDRAERVNPVTVARSLLERHRSSVSAGSTERSLEFALLALRAAEIAPPVPAEVVLAVASSQRRLADELLAPAQESGGDRLIELARLDPATREQARVHLIEAGRAYKRHADSLGALDNEAFGQSLWSAADAFDLAGDQELAIPLLNDFARFFPADRRVAQARLRLGQAYQSRGDYDTAAEQYRLLIAEGAGDNRATALAERAYVPLAQTLLLDDDAANDAEAERLLANVVSGRAVSAGGREYREALVELAGLKARRGDWSGAIQHLEEAVGRFADFDGADSARYNLAEAHRRDAEAMLRTLQEAMPEQQRQETISARRERLRRAAQMYEMVRAAYERQDPRRLSRLERLQLRNAYFYLGDSAFALGDYEEAIRRYDTARERFPDDPASLVAMVQIVNSYVELGDMERARTAQARAKRFYDGIPATAWSDPDLPMGRDAWQRWLDSMSTLKPLERAPASAAATAAEAAPPPTPATDDASQAQAPEN